MAKDPFESPKLTLEEARANIDDVKAQIDAYFASDMEAVFVELDPETGEKLYKAKIIAEIPGAVRTRASSAISHLRHALDQACYAAAVVLAPGGGRSQTNFVFADDPDNLEVLFVKAAKHIPSILHPVL